MHAGCASVFEFCYTRRRLLVWLNGLRFWCAGVPVARRLDTDLSTAKEFVVAAGPAFTMRVALCQCARVLSVRASSARVSHRPRPCPLPPLCRVLARPACGSEGCGSALLCNHARMRFYTPHNQTTRTLPPTPRAWPALVVRESVFENSHAHASLPCVAVSAINTLRRACSVNRKACSPSTQRDQEIWVPP